MVADALERQTSSRGGRGHRRSRGPCDGLETAWGEIMGWVQDHGHEPADLICWECYLTDPDSEPDPARWQTQLFVPLKA